MPVGERQPRPVSENGGGGLGQIAGREQQRVRISPTKVEHPLDTVEVDVPRTCRWGLLDEKVITRLHPARLPAGYGLLPLVDTSRIAEYPNG